MDLSQGIDGYIKANTSNGFRRVVKLQEAWKKIAPQNMLKFTDNVIESKKQDDAIVIYVSNPTVASALDQSREYYRQMLEYETGEKISRIFFQTSRRAAERKQFEELEDTDETPWYIDDCKPVPLDEEELAYVRLTLAEVEDEKLKESLFNALVSDMEWKKGKKAKKSPQK